MARGRVGPDPGAHPIEAMEAIRRTLSLASLQRTRALLRNRKARLLVVAIALVYAVVAMVVGQILTFPGLPGPFFSSVQWTGDPWWDFPELFLFGGSFALDLLFLPTLTMLLVSAGVGVGVTAALFTAFPSLRALPKAKARDAATTSAAGASAAVTGLATMACCCTTCASAAGAVAVAAASGTNLVFLLGQAWYLNLFQLVVLGLALTAQERSLRQSAEACRADPTVDRAFVLGVALRLALLVAGITWSLAMFVEWMETPPLAAGPALWYHWIVEHQLLAVTAVAAGMFPQETAAWIANAYARRDGWVLRALLLVGGITWGLGVPPPLTGLGLGGFGNELLGLAGAPAAWGAVATDLGLGPALLFHWGFQHLLLAAFAVVLAVLPQTAMAPLLRTADGKPLEGTPASAAQAGA